MIPQRTKNAQADGYPGKGATDASSRHLEQIWDITKNEGLSASTMRIYKIENMYIYIYMWYIYIYMCDIVL